MNLALLSRGLIFTQVLLGIVAWCIADRSPGLLLVAWAVGAMSWCVTEGPRGRAVPRWLVNLGGLGAVLWMGQRVYDRQMQMVVAMGHFTLVLQLLMLYMRKTGREYSQLLVLSLLQIVSASILSISVVFGFFLTLYCAVAVATVLVYHLSTSADRVHLANRRAAGAWPPPAPPEARATRVAGRYLLRWGVYIGVVCAGVAAVVFVALPRLEQAEAGPRAAAGAAAGDAAPRQTGFRNTVQLGSGAIGNGSREPVLNLRLSSGGKPLGNPDQAWLLRGVPLDVYNPQNHTWLRSQFATARDRVVELDPVLAPPGPGGPGAGSQYEAEVVLRDVRHRTIFSVLRAPSASGTLQAKVSGFESDQIDALTFSPLDDQMGLAEAASGALTYRLSWPARSLEPAAEKIGGQPVWSAPIRAGVFGRPYARAPVRREHDSELARPFWRRLLIHAAYGGDWEVQTDRVRELALSVIRRRGLDRDPAALYSPDDLKIAGALAHHLGSEYGYDLLNPVPPPGQDPVVTFLFERRRGHCELFAAGLAAMCRSIGIPARLVTGFRASEFNAIGNYYVVRPSNAHAWVEVYAGAEAGWAALDATPAASVQAEHRVPGGWLSFLRLAYEHLEFAWIRQVVAFDAGTRERLFRKVEGWVVARGSGVESWLSGRWAWLTQSAWRYFADRLESLAILSVLAGLCLAALFFVRSRVRRRRRRRIAWLELSRLPPDAQRRLGGSLGFYLKMLDILERRGFRRPHWQSPQDFADRLAQTHPLRFDPVVALTEMFYDIRFGHRSLNDEDRKRIRAHLKRLEQTVAGHST